MSSDHSGQPRLCLDFGTAFSKASLYLGGALPAREAVLPLAIGAISRADHPFLTPSVMFVDEGRILIGPVALERAQRAASVNRDPILSFKTILAARDLEPALAQKIPPSVDPTSTLRQRDTLVLYLAHLDQLVRAVIKGDATLPPSAADAARRYTSPIWRMRDEADRTMSRLFDEAAIVSVRLGERLIAPDGVSIAQAKDALDKGEQTLGIGQLEASVFEAHAAAAAYAAFSRAPQRFVLVVDMGAGTTDLAGFERLEGGDGQALSEVVRARQSCGLAGNEIDEVLVNLALAKSRPRRGLSEEQLWRSLRLSARKLKRDLFLNGKCAFEHDGKVRTLMLGELTRAPAFKAFCRAFAEICAASVRAVAERAKLAGESKLTILLAGGGANLKFLTEVANAAGARGGEGLKIEIETFGVNWYLPRGYDPFLQDAFPQVAISLGGALAHLADEPANAAALA
ncbi:Hsp70 family protein [Terricaulis silvestris]|uniref:Hsp70 protein n=1 Tax=Terricaulis silvestris TaxID=2686094 RepID=A0A6I6ML46_9CAUL|nr:Hsp70 family protein [Terricaulis silvestris]QGZ93377.1 Hsp70 protein [Terricaulis silvestris]